MHVTAVTTRRTCLQVAIAVYEVSNVSDCRNLCETFEIMFARMFARMLVCNDFCIHENMSQMLWIWRRGYMKSTRCPNIKRYSVDQVFHHKRPGKFSYLAHEMILYESISKVQSKNHINDVELHCLAINCACFHIDHSPVIHSHGKCLLIRCRCVYSPRGVNPTC